MGVGGCRHKFIARAGFRNAEFNLRIKLVINMNLIVCLISRTLAVKGYGNHDDRLDEAQHDVFVADAFL